MIEFSQILQTADQLPDSPKADKKQLVQIAEIISSHVERETFAGIFSEDMLSVLKNLLNASYRLGYQTCVEDYLSTSKSGNHYIAAVNKHSAKWQKEINIERIQHITRDSLVEHLTNTSQS